LEINHRFIIRQKMQRDPLLTHRDSSLAIPHTIGAVVTPSDRMDLLNISSAHLYQSAVFRESIFLVTNR
jgi:hypothetical protein